MKKELIELSLKFLLSKWIEINKDAVMQGAWIAIREPMGPGDSEPSSPMTQSYYLTNSGWEERDLWELKRFASIHFDDFLDVSRAPDPNRKFETGWASVCEQKQTNFLYIGFQFGSLLGEGLLFSVENNSLIEVTKLWLS